MGSRFGGRGDLPPPLSSSTLLNDEELLLPLLLIWPEPSQAKQRIPPVPLGLVFGMGGRSGF